MCFVNKNTIIKHNLFLSESDIANYEIWNKKVRIIRMAGRPLEPQLADLTAAAVRLRWERTRTER